MTFREQVDWFVRGIEIPHRTHDAIEMYITLDNMQWNHLPVAGGWYDQHPDFVKKMQYIMTTKAVWDREQEAKEKRKGPQVPIPKNR